MKGEAFYATGRRKSAIARVWLRPGTGKVLINRSEPLAYLNRDVLRMVVEQPLVTAGGVDKFDVDSYVSGGGKSAQADAIRLGIARALVVYNSELRGDLRRGGFLTRDPRIKERKKYGQPGARKRFQYSKR